MRNTVMLFLVNMAIVVATAVAAAASEVSSGRDLDANRDFLEISETEMAVDHQKSMAERMGCRRKARCIRSDGYCVKSSANCDGRVDPKGCRGGKCKCCIPDKSSTPPMTCPTCPTCPAVTSPTVTPCPTTAPMTCPDVTCPVVTPCPTTTPMTCPDVTCPDVTPCPTTEAVTMNPKLRWISVGSDRFVRSHIDGDALKMDWHDAREFCRSNGLDLYHPDDIARVAIELDSSYSDWDRYYWLGAQGNGTHQVWFSGEVVTRDAPWYSDDYEHVGTNDCLSIQAFGNKFRDNMLIAPQNGCTGRTDHLALCG